jgi:hypothetical protein
MAQVNDLAALILKDAADDADGGIVAIKQGGGRDKPRRRLADR